MKIVVFADSHNDVDTMIEVIEVMKPDMVIHLGDHARDAIELDRHFKNLTVEYVRGNTDLASGSPSKKVVMLDGISAFITHGHEYNVKAGYDKVVEAAAREGADIVLFGHTHKPCLMEINGIRVMNPGRIGRKSQHVINATFGVIETEDNDINCKIVDFDSLY